MHEEIAIAGAGPAGATAALQLSRLGYKVTIFEKCRFPRPRIGESLTPGIIPILEQLGLSKAVNAAGFLRPTSAIVKWDTCRDRIWFDGSEPGYQVDRARFDTILLDAALAAGASVEWSPLPECMDGFVIDASGRRGVLPGPRVRMGQPLLALYAYWYGADIHDSGTIVEAGSREWIWAAPLPDGSLNITVFLDPRDARQPESSYSDAVRRSSLLGPMSALGKRGPIHATDASCWLSQDPAGERYIRAGEAAFCVDALSSQGVQLAMQSGWQAATAVHTILAGGDAGAAREFYRARQLSAAVRNHRIATSYYAQLADRGHFWADRSIAADIEVPPEPAARLVGDYITRT